MNPLDESIVAVVAQALHDAGFNMSQIRAAFGQAGPFSDSTAQRKAQLAERLLAQCNQHDVHDAHAVLGKVLKVLFGVDTLDGHPQGARITEALAQRGLSYLDGRILGRGLTAATETFIDLVRRCGIPEVQNEFDRLSRNMVADPGAAVTAACTMLEACCCGLIDKSGGGGPSEKTAKPLYDEVSRRLGIHPSGAHGDLKIILGALNTVVDGIAKYRTHKGSAHGRTEDGEPVEVRHARLACQGAQAVVMFLLETWLTQNPQVDAK
jgi:hypothetical protein